MARPGWNEGRRAGVALALVALLALISQSRDGRVELSGGAAATQQLEYDGPYDPPPLTWYFPGPHNQNTLGYNPVGKPAAAPQYVQYDVIKDGNFQDTTVLKEGSSSFGYSAQAPTMRQAPARRQEQLRQELGRGVGAGMRVRGQALAYDSYFDTPPVTWFYPAGYNHNTLGYDPAQAEYQKPTVTYQDSPTTVKQNIGFNTGPTTEAYPLGTGIDYQYETVDYSDGLTARRPRVQQGLQQSRLQALAQSSPDDVLFEGLGPKHESARQAVLPGNVLSDLDDKILALRGGSSDRIRRRLAKEEDTNQRLEGLRLGRGRLLAKLEKEARGLGLVVK